MKINSIRNSFNGIKVKKQAQAEGENSPSEQSSRLKQNAILESTKTQVNMMKESAQATTRPVLDFFTPSIKRNSEDNHATRVEKQEKTAQLIEYANANLDTRMQYTQNIINIYNDLKEKIAEADREDTYNVNLKRVDRLATANQSQIEGLNKIAGYEKEKATLYSEFISKIDAEKNGEEVALPSSILFFGPSNNGKTETTKAIAQATGCNIKKVRIPNATPTAKQKAYENIIQIARESEEEFKKTKTRTIIFIDEIDKLLKEDFTNQNDLIKFLETCSDKYHCTVFAATNYPRNLGIDYKKSNAFAIRMSVDPPNFKNKIAVLKHYAKIYGFDNEWISYGNIAKSMEEIEKDRKSRYSNSDIKTICHFFALSNNKLKPSDKDVSDFIIDRLQKDRCSDDRIFPSISENDMYGFRRDYDYIIDDEV